MMSTMIHLSRRGELRRALAWLAIGWLLRSDVTVTVWKATDGWKGR
jgi:hypothetical protein